MLLVAALGLLLLAQGSPSTAGQGRYDPATRSIKLTYTFASLAPGYAGASAIGRPQEPTNEQHAVVRGLLKDVNDALVQATSGRLSIGSLDRVDDTRNVDIVISLTGRPPSAGWAIMGGSEGRPGQIGLFYQTLADNTKYVRRDAVLAAAHELCHYLFALTDEYNFPRGCPLDNPGAPGCLMDNYNTNGVRHGWYGRFCNDSDHVRHPVQPRSCQSLVDEYFAARGNPQPDLYLSDEDRLRQLAGAAAGKAREEAAARLATSSSTSPVYPRTVVRASADRFLKEQVDRLDLNVPPSVLRQAVDDATRDAVRIPLGNPGRLDAPLIARLRARAGQLVATMAGKTETSRRLAIVRELLGMVKSAVASASAPVTRDERRFIEQLALEAASRSADELRFEKLVEAARLQIRFDQETAVTTVEIADELGIPGTPARLDVLRELDEELRKNALPGRTSSRFGRRRTLIIAPDPIDPRYDYIATKDGIHNYDDLRSSCIDEFNRLIDRAKVLPTLVDGTEVQKTPFASPGPGRLGEAEQEARAGNDSAMDRQRSIQRILAQAIDQIRRNRIENIIVVVPPGGLPPDLGRSLETIRGELSGKTDLRLDVVILAEETIPAQLRDLSIRSGGSVLTIIDIDEVGALAQRLKNAQTAGAWVVLPLQDVIPRSPARAGAAADAGQDDPDRAFKDAAEYRAEVLRVLTEMAESAQALGKLISSEDVADLSTALGRVTSRVRELDDARAAEMTYDEFLAILRPFVRAQSYLRRIEVDLIGKVRGTELPEAPGAFIKFRGAQDGDADAPDQDSGRKSRADAEALVRGLAADFRLINRWTSPIIKPVQTADRFDRARQAEVTRTLIVPDLTDEKLAAVQEAAKPGDGPATPSRKLDATGRDYVMPLVPFFAEAGAKFELIVGSTEPLPGVSLPLARETSPWSRLLPRIRLTDEKGTPLEAPAVLLDRDASTDTILVYRLDYTEPFDGRFFHAELLLNREEYEKLDHDINFTFSVSSSRPNIHLYASLDQAPANPEAAPPPADRGTIRVEEGQARVEVQVYGGTSVRDARVFGGLQKLNKGNDPIDFSVLTFKDDGKEGDRKADDGVYTAVIPIDRLAEPAEYRVSIQALSTPTSRNIVPEDPNAADAERRKILRAEGFTKILEESPLLRIDPEADAGQYEKALRFQRATSFHFRVER